MRQQPTMHPEYPRHLPARNPLRPRAEVDASWRQTLRATRVAVVLLVRVMRHPHASP